MLNSLIASMFSLVFWSLILILFIAFLKGFFKYKKTKVKWLGEERTLYYYLEDDITNWGIGHKYHLRDFHLLYFSLSSEVSLTTDRENNRIKYANIWLSDLNRFARKSWLRDLVLKLPKKKDFLQAMEIADKDSSSDARKNLELFTDLMYPEVKAFQKIIDQLPKPASMKEAKDIITELPE